MTALMFAAQNGHEQVALVLLEAGVALLSASVPPSATLIAGWSAIGVRVAAAPVKAFYEIELIAIGSCPRSSGWHRLRFCCRSERSLGRG